MGRRYSREAARAWVIEEVGDDEQGQPLALGLFSTHVESPELADGSESGPVEVPVENALAWARERASRVVVRVCTSWENDFYSGGDEQWSPQNPLPAWRPGGLELERRRLPGWEFVDRTPSDPPIDWDVKLEALRGSAEPPADFAARFGEALAEQSEAADVDWVAFEDDRVADEPGEGGSMYRAYAPGPSVAVARFRLRARTVGEAEALAAEIAEHAGRQALTGLGIDPNETPMPCFWEAAAYAAGSQAAARNARIRYEEDAEDGGS
jgi:hypothetical protein